MVTYLVCRMRDSKARKVYQTSKKKKISTVIAIDNCLLKYTNLYCLLKYTNCFEILVFMHQFLPGCYDSESPIDDDDESDGFRMSYK